MTLHSLLEICRRFRGTFCYSLQDRVAACTNPLTLWIYFRPLYSHHTPTYTPPPPLQHTALSTRRCSYFNNDRQSYEPYSTRGKELTSVHFSGCVNREVTAVGPSVVRWHAQGDRLRALVPKLAKANINLRTSRSIRLSFTYSGSSSCLALLTKTCLHLQGQVIVLDSSH